MLKPQEKWRHFSHKSVTHAVFAFVNQDDQDAKDVQTFRIKFAGLNVYAASVYINGSNTHTHSFATAAIDLEYNTPVTVHCPYLCVRVC